MPYAFDPSQHPRDPIGRFSAVLEGLTKGDHAHLPSGVKVHNRGDRFIVKNHKGERVGSTKDPVKAAEHAMHLHNGHERLPGDQGVGKFGGKGARSGGGTPKPDRPAAIRNMDDQSLKDEIQFARQQDYRRSGGLSDGERQRLAHLEDELASRSKGSKPTPKPPTPKPPTPKPAPAAKKPDATVQKIQSDLTKAGHSKTTSHSTRIAGYHRISSGHDVTAGPGGHIHIRHQDGQIRTGENAKKVQEEHLGRYQKVLEDAGHTVEHRGDYLAVKGGDKHVEQLQKKHKEAKSDADYSRRQEQGAAESSRQAYAAGNHQLAQYWDKQRRKYADSRIKAELRAHKVEDALPKQDAVPPPEPPKPPTPKPSTPKAGSVDKPKLVKIDPSAANRQYGRHTQISQVREVHVDGKKAGELRKHDHYYEVDSSSSIAGAMAKQFSEWKFHKTDANGRTDSKAVKHPQAFTQTEALGHAVKHLKESGAGGDVPAGPAAGGPGFTRGDQVTHTGRPAWGVGTVHGSAGTDHHIVKFDRRTENDKVPTEHLQPATTAAAPEPKFRGAHHSVEHNGKHFVFDRHGQVQSVHDTPEEAGSAVTRNAMDDPGGPPTGASGSLTDRVQGLKRGDAPLNVGNGYTVEKFGVGWRVHHNGKEVAGTGMPEMVQSIIQHHQTRVGHTPEPSSVTAVKRSTDGGHQVSIRLGERQLSSVLRSGRFRSGVETGQSSQTEDLVTPEDKQLYFEHRKAHEQSLFGHHPIYGYAHGGGIEDIGGGQYGDVRVQLKPEAHKKATFTVGDSLTTPGAKPRPLSELTPEAVKGQNYDYVETQLKDAGVNDIHSVHFSQHPTQSLIDDLHKRGIGVTVGGRTIKPRIGQATRSSSQPHRRGTRFGAGFPTKSGKAEAARKLPKR